MAKAIKLTAAEIDAVIQEFKNRCEESNGSLLDSSIECNGVEFTFKKKRNDIKVEEKAKVILTSKAWMKTKLLVDKFSSEVGWYYVADRGENANEFILIDVYVFPQEVTGSTVRMDIGETQKWSFEIPDDIYMRFRGHGHSHNSMGTTPSKQDEDTRVATIATQPDDGFYVFAIWNKKYEVNLTVLDLASNIQYESKDCELEVQDDDGYLKLADDAEKYVKKTTYASSWSGKSGYYGGYNGKYNSKSNTTSAKPEDKKVVPIESSDKDKKEQPKEKKVVNAGDVSSYYGGYDYDDPYGYYDDIRGAYYY